MERQPFSIELHHPEPFSTKGRELWSAAGEVTTSAEWEGWLESGRLKSLEYPGVLVLCCTAARVRRTYRSGVVVKDFPDVPYVGWPPAWIW